MRANPVKLQYRMFIFPSLKSGHTEIFTLLGCSGKLICSKKIECATLLSSVSWVQIWVVVQQATQVPTMNSGHPAGARAGDVLVDNGVEVGGGTGVFNQHGPWRTCVLGHLMGGRYKGDGDWSPHAECPWVSPAVDGKCGN